MKLIRILLIVIFILFFYFNSIGSDKQGPDLKDLNGPYLGEKPPGDTPHLFGSGIVSTKKGWEAAVTFSPDGKEFFFTRRATIAGADNRLMYMVLKNGRWSYPAPAPFAKNITEYESFISPDGKKIFYNSESAKPGIENAKGEIWYSEKTSEGWSDAKYLSKKINKGWVMFVTASSNNTLYFTGGCNRKFGIYRSRFVKDEYQEPEYLPMEIMLSERGSPVHRKG